MIAARRTAVVPRGGAFAKVGLVDLAVPVVAACLADAGIAAEEVEEIIVSNALGAGGNVARLVALAAGLPERVAGLTIDRQCAGGLDAVLLARALVEAGMADVVVAGGVESYSRRPLRFWTDPEGGPAVEYDAPPFTPWPERDPKMMVAAAALALNLGISREAQDFWAVRSHERALAARLEGEIVPVSGVGKDAFARALTMEIARRAKGLCGSVTVANAAVAADAAGFVVVVSERRVKACHRALRIAGGATLGGRPEAPGTAPVLAIAEVLGRAGLRPADLQAVEIMEAYAIQALACIQGAGLDPALVNLGGGALARGHPIGASGGILAVRLFHEVQHGHGLAAIAAAGGIGTALLLAAG